MDELGQIDFAHHGRHDVRVFQVEVVGRPVEVGGHHGHVVGAILQIVALAHLEPGNFGNGILLVGVFEWRGEQGILAHGLGRILRIDARGAEEEQLLHAVQIGLLDDVALHLHVLHDEVGTVERVGHDAPYEGSGQHHGFGPLGIEELRHGPLVRQVQFAVASPHQIPIPPLLEVLPNGRSHESTVAGNINLAILA